MSFDPAESMLTTGDYRRLGVRESEARARVIRHAAHQLAEPLARRQLVAPDVQTEADLVEAVTSTYRLLDPRRRASAVERALLTQLEPVRAVEPRWAHPKALAGKKNVSTHGPRFDPVQFESIPADSTTLFPEPAPPRFAPSSLAVALDRLASCHDRVRRYRRTSWREKWYLWLGLPALILLLLAIRPMLTGGGGNSPPPVSAPSPVEASDLPASPAPRPSSTKPRPTTSSPRQSGPSTTSAAEPAEADVAGMTPAEASSPPQRLTGNAPSRQVGPSVPSELISADATPTSDLAVELADPASSVESATDVLPPTREKDDADESSDSDTEKRSDSGVLGLVQSTPERTGAASESGVAQTGIVQADDAAVDEGEADVSREEPAADVPPRQDRAEPPAAPPRRAPLPSPADLEQSRSRLQKLLGDRPKAVSETQQMREVEWLLDLRKDSPPGSSDALVIAQLAVAKLVAAGRYLQAAAIIDELEGKFDAEETQLGRSTTEQLVETAGSLAEHRRIVAWCLMLSEKYFQAELFDGATELARLGTTSAVKLGDADLRSRLSQRRDAIATARRTADSVWKIMERSSPRSATATDAAQAGRYLCLMIRDWEQGLPWLANGSDSRLAAAAQQELVLTGQADAPVDQPEVDGGTVAKSWLDASDRFRGRLGDSAKLHAYELIDQAMEESAGLRTLELKKQLDALREELPEDLIPSQEESAPAANRLAGGAGGQPAMAAESGIMEGRLTLGGRDMGAVIRYSPGVQLSQDVIDQIFGALRIPVAPWAITFEGMLQLDKAATIRFIASGPTAPDGQTTVRVNSNRLALVEGVRGRSAAVDLAAGTHRVTWQISGTKLDEAFVLLQDELTGDRLQLAAPPADPRSLPARLRINIQRAP